MNAYLKTVALLVCSLSAGFIGGVLGANYAKNLETSVVRSKRVELLDESGNTVAYWGKGSTGDFGIVFIGKGNRPQTFLGLRSDTPALVLSGYDGEPRVDLFLSYESHNRPTMYLLDERKSRRMHLGYAWNDLPDVRDDNWMLSFEAPQGAFNLPLASIGMGRKVNGVLGGGMSARDQVKR